MGLRRVLGAIGSTRGAYRPIAEKGHYISRFAALPFVLVHVPKTGGTAILETVGLSRPRVHATAWELRTDPCEQLRGKELVAVYRDPLARFRSACRYYLRGGNGGRSDRRMQLLLEHHMSSGDFKSPAGLMDLALANRAFWPQAAYLLDPYGGLCVDRLFRVRNLTEEFNAYCRLKRLDLPRLEKINVGEPTDFDLPDATIEAVRSLYECDYALAAGFDTGPDGPDSPDGPAPA